MKPIVFVMCCCAGVATAQPPEFGPPPFGPPGFGRGGPGGPGGRGPGGMMGQKQKLVQKFDKDGDGILNAAERKAAMEYLASNAGGGGRGGRRGFGAFGGRGGFGGSSNVEIKPGIQLAPKDVKQYGKEPLYDMGTLRTLFFQFDDADWEKELSAFYKTDVDIPATLTVDGKVYKDVGVHIRGNTSSMMVPEGGKRSLGVSINFVNDQRLLGYRSLNLLNSNADPTFLRTALYHYIARQYIAAPQANWVRVVLNGENWGIYVNTQQINGDLAKDFFKTTKGARWKVSGSPNGRGGLAYLGDDPEPYKRIYEIKSKDTKESWTDLIHLCKVLNQTPPAELQKELAPILDVDGALKFLALDKATINNDGFWTRASDYSIYEDPDGKFHVIPWDANETFREPENSGSDDATLDIFAGANDPNKALLNKLLAVPALRAKYVADIQDIATNWFDWKKMGPLVERWQSLIAEDVKKDTRKIFSTEAFTKALTVDGFEPGRGPTAPPYLSLKSFMEQRRAYLLKN